MPLDEAERILSLQMALKCSDLAHTTAGLSVHLNWVSNLEEEVTRELLIIASHFSSLKTTPTLTIFILSKRLT